VVETGGSFVNNWCVFWYHEKKSVLTVQRRLIKMFYKENTKIKCPCTKDISCSMWPVAFVKEKSQAEENSLRLR
jgi:hypothetical protein